MRTPSRKILGAMVAEAVVDCWDDDEQRSGLLAMVEEHLALPFATVVLGVPVMVEAIVTGDDGGILAVCVAGPHRQAVGLLDLPLPDPAPEGAEWIAAYRLWVG
ncbi:hypothetical protein [Embleya sp. AB8]|uniref:hypothetical protein n=1 Tax=Embleya sp. AB8 TaxID=3156304 RepID=UPI003C77E7C7